MRRGITLSVIQYYELYEEERPMMENTVGASHFSDRSELPQ